MSGRTKTIIFFSILVLLILSVAGWFFYFKNQPDRNRPISQEKKSEQAAAVGFNQEKYALVKKAGQQKDPSLCNALSGDEKDNCLVYVFESGNDASICEQVTNQEIKQKCLDENTYNDAFKNKEVKKCDKIIDDRIKRQCYRAVLGQFSSIGDCDSFEGEIKKLCLDSVYYRMSIEAHSRELCDQVNDVTYKTECQDELNNEPLDQDQDGLSDYYETMLSTDPFKADSDGDGCKDGDELKSGHNPLIKNDGAGDGPDCLKFPLKRK